MSSTAVALVAWLLLIFVPGFALLRLVRLPGSPGVLLAGSAPVSLGLIYLVGLAATRAAISVRYSCLTALLVLVVAWLAVEWRRAPSHPGASPSPRARFDSAISAAAAPWRVPARATGRALALVSVVVGVLLWHQVQAHLTVPAGWDAMHHAYFVRQIATHDTLSSSVVFSTEPNGPADGVGFYPLAMNLVAALIHLWTGASISAVLLASSVAIVGVSLPLAVYGLVRRLLPEQPVTAGLAALASVLPALLYIIEYTGRVTDVQGLAMVPAAVSLLVAFGCRFDWRQLVVGALALTGVVGLHTTELPIVLGLVIAFVVVEVIRSRTWRSTGGFVLGIAGASAATGLLLLAFAPGIRSLVSQRTGSFGPAHGGNLSLRQALHYVSELPQWGPLATREPMRIWVSAALIGCVLILILPKWRPLAAMAIGYLGYAVFYTAWVWGHVGPFAFLANSWYRVYTRMQWEFCVLGAVPVGVSMAVAAALVSRGILAIRRRRNEPATRGQRTIAAVAAACVVVAIAVPMLAPLGVDARFLRNSGSPVGQHEQAAFRYLQQHVHPGERVLDDLQNHGDLWMFADYGVPNLFGNPPPIGAAPADWKERLYLRARLSMIASDGCVNRLLGQFDVGWVYYSANRLAGGKIHIPLSTLRSTPAIQLAFSSGGASVYRIDRSGLPTRCATNLTSGYPWTTIANAK